VTEPLQRAFEYWRNVDTNLGGKVEAGLRAGQGEKDPKAVEQANPAASTCRPRPDHHPTQGPAPAGHRDTRAGWRPAGVRARSPLITGR
jgi:hypothetical protein